MFQNIYLVRQFASVCLKFDRTCSNLKIEMHVVLKYPVSYT